LSVTRERPDDVIAFADDTPLRATETTTLSHLHGVGGNVEVVVLGWVVVVVVVVVEVVVVVVVVCSALHVIGGS